LNEEILNYIRQYRGYYTREAISANLYRAGFRPEDIEQAWAIVEGIVPPPVSQKPHFWLGLLLYPTLVIGSIILGVVFSSGIFLYLAFGIFIGGIIVSVIIDQRDRPLAKGLNFAFVGMLVLLIVAPFVAIIVVIGICLTGNYRY